MPLTKFQLRPGVVRETTNYINQGGWFDCNKVRFRSGLPETIGGWTRLTRTQLLGTCRSLHVWSTLDGTNYTGAGTNLKLYVLQGDTPTDITPIRLTTTGAATFAAVDGSATLTITDAANGVSLNDFVTFTDAVSLGGNITALVLNQEYQVTNVVDANTYEIVATATANASDTGNGGASTVAAYQITTGLDTVILGSGWGAGYWGRGTWSSAADISIPGSQLTLWSQDNFGEDLLANVRSGGVYYWDASAGIGFRAVNITSISGQKSAPVVANQILVSERDRHVLAFGCNPEFDSDGLATIVQDPLVIRFSSQESFTDWQTRADNTAGELRISSGSEIVAAVQTKQQVIVFTNMSVNAMQFIGPPYTFSLNEVSTNISILGQNAAIAVGDSVYWMGDGQFYVYDGNVRQVPCAVKEYVFSDFNRYQALKVVAGGNAAFGEVWWFYPAENSDNNDRYVVFNYEQNIWYYGTIDRTAWSENGVVGYPIAASPDGYLYYHEFGFNDGSTVPETALNAFIESSGIELGDGDSFMFANRLIPDLTFRNSTATSPVATFTLKARNFPGGTFLQSGNENVTSTSVSPIQLYTDQVFIRIRGRSVAMRIESDQLNTAWRLGAPRIDVRPDGRR
jgi:protein involved in ribonucleotide reduction